MRLTSVCLILSLFFVQNSFAEKTLSGKWQQECLNGNFRSEDFAESFVTYEENYFSDQNCKQPVLSLIIEGDYQTDSQKIDFRYFSVHATARSISLVENYNQHRTCGLSDWSLDQAKDVTGLHCDLFGFGKEFQNPQKGDKRFGIWKVEKTQLWFGQISREFDGSTPEKRPRVWNPRFYLQSN